MSDPIQPITRVRLEESALLELAKGIRNRPGSGTSRGGIEQPKKWKADASLVMDAKTEALLATLCEEFAID